MSQKGRAGKKISDFDFHLRNIKFLKEDSDYLLKIEEFPKKDKDHFYIRPDKSGWWMVTKQIIIRKYIEAYLNILGGQKDIDIYFLDILSSWGMNRVTKQSKKHRFTFPGTAISAGLISSKKERGFNEIFMNDYDPIKRKVLDARFNAINNTLENKLNFNIDTSENKIDSNEWVLKIMQEITEKPNYKKNYLMVIDNEGMNISYETLKKVRELSQYGDFIINFQDVMIARQINNINLIKSFFGRELSTDTKQVELCEIYQEQLKKIGFGRIESIKIETTGGYYYTLLFCCRKTSSYWLRMIEKYRDDRFRLWTDSKVKQFWDIVSGYTRPLF